MLSVTMALPRILFRGSSRTVILTRRWAFKIPGAWTHPGWRWRSFLNGLLSNIQKRAFAALGYPQLCPVRFALPGSPLVVMPRAEPLTDDEFLALGPDAFRTAAEHPLPVEPKTDSFGRLGGRVVAVDYGIGKAPPRAPAPVIIAAEGTRP